MPAYIHTYIHTYIHICKEACLHAYIHIYTYACMHAYIHMYTFACLHGMCKRRYAHKPTNTRALAALAWLSHIRHRVRMYKTYSYPSAICPLESRLEIESFGLFQVLPRCTLPGAQAVWDSSSEVKEPQKEAWCMQAVGRTM